MPQNIVLFERFFYASVALGVIHLMLVFPGAQDGVPAAGGVVFLAIVVVLTAALSTFNILLVWLTARRNSNVARWVLTGLVFASLVYFAATIGEMSLNNLTAALVNALIAAMQVICIYLVFTGDAPDWFR